MPIYEYKCKSCGHELEKIQKVSEAPLTLCPKCDKNELERLVSSGGFRIRGAGVYKPTSKMD